ncbi:hypothetical protein [Psychrobacter sp. FDAARGOS_221]|uniref:hypothetical protein n=1 Tax=Psychrobacter sp. FDAARGOS_221 TaxID=1975705 RepID=UPI000BB566A8|nr:hypothetical protein [Psychrobacter sp. FDAARGOS_221]PNK59585.1 hypothetical protein A6J60_000910 [Psychrobacter sp. FDAARGOS_221]
MTSMTASIKTLTVKSLFIATLLPSVMTGCQLQSQTEVRNHSHHSTQLSTRLHGEHAHGTIHGHQGTMNHGNHKNQAKSEAKKDISGHYSRRLSDTNQVHVHVNKVGLVTPSKKISLSLSSLSTAKNASNGQQPACEYRGTATLMGQDALHGLIYTIPVSSLLNNKSAAQSNASETNKSTDNGLLFFRFKEGVLSIDSNNPTVLNSFCTGSTSIKGDYYPQ